MNITLAQYITDNDSNVGVNAVIDGITMSVPLDLANRHYATLLEWAEQDGNTIEEAD